jgi:UPF0755 protein
MSDSKEKSRNPLLEERVSQAKVVRKIVFFCVIAFTIIAAIAMLSGYFYMKSALGPMEKQNEEVVEVTIPIGSSSTQIGRVLEEAGLVKSATFFRYYVRYKNESGFQAGNYALSPSMTIDEMIEELKEGKVLQEPELVFTVPEGRWLEDVSEIIAAKTSYSAEDVMNILTDRDYIEGLIEQYEMLSETILNEEIRYPLEGYLFPARYDFMIENPSIEEIIEAMLDRTEEVVNELSADIEESGYSIHELMTLASIIEREAQTSEDRYLISGVLHNRLESGMKLQVDPSVAYALGEHRYMTTYEDLEIDSPYNTYRYEGIPVGPIANPGKESIQAAVIPEETNYLYFYARYNGEVLYNETYEAHNQAHQMYRDEWIEAEKQEENEE